ncbi:unnamed protein product [Caenorhabditis auriculariae]|uniref:Uncharacterized protein n=1 Tax=Caenorhabditis auriculariae TaxID=2777116 RepID=A0A8S1GZ28_9PELO|nr:unnamed protein product [Caenorhabditis auriculariae]
MFRLLVTGLKQIVQVTDDSDVSFLKGRQMNDIKDCDEAGQTRRICEEMIPLIHKEKVAGNLQKVENIDVFCEKGVFGVESTMAAHDEIISYVVKRGTLVYRRNDPYLI